MVYFFNSCYFYLFFLSNEGEVQTVLGKKSEIKVPIALDRKSKTKKKKIQIALDMKSQLKIQTALDKEI